MKERIGIYAGTFDPVHAGHVSLALYAQQRAKLDKVYFLPERHPRYKPNVLHISHRIAMLEEALKPYPTLGVMELVDTNFSVKRVVPQLRSKFGEDQLVFLFGSDVFCHIPSWPLANVLAEIAEFVVGVRVGDDIEQIELVGNDFTGDPNNILILDNFYPDVSSKMIRTALGRGRTAPGILDSATRYAVQNGLYTTESKQLTTVS